MRNQNLISLAIAIAIHLLAFYFLIVSKSVHQAQGHEASIQNFGPRHFIISDISIQSKPRQVSATESTVLKSKPPTLSNESSLVHSESSNSEIAEKSLGHDLSPALYDSLPLPTYPRLAREKALEGIVKISASYDQNGAITQIKLSQSSGHQLLDDAVINAVRDWKIHASSSGHFEKSFEFKLR